MLTHSQLVALHRSLRDTRVLSVYIDGSANDPAIQRSWRVQLDHSLADLRRWLDGSSHDEREQLTRCIALLDAELATLSAGVGAPGWAAFITADGVRHATRLPAPAPTLAVWSNGPSIAPYVRALKETHPVIVVVADARQAVIYQYRLGELEREDVLHSHHFIDHPEHMGTPPRVGFHTGTRGTAGHDAAQRSLLTGRDRMLAATVERVHDLAGADGWILVGGIRRVATRLAHALAELAPQRVLQLETLHLHSTDAERAALARSGASTLRENFDERRVAAIEELAGGQGLGALGPADARVALERASVRDLYVTPRYVENHAADAEVAIRAALDQDASVEAVSGRAAERLDSHGGIAAGLRFRVAAPA